MYYSILRMIILPRQAQDKHIGKVEKRDAFPSPGLRRTTMCCPGLDSTRRRWRAVCSTTQRRVTAATVLITETFVVSVSFALPFYTETDHHFTKTGSGQT